MSGAQAVGALEVPVPQLVLLGVEVLLAAGLARRVLHAARTPGRRCRSSRASVAASTSRSDERRRGRRYCR